MKAKYTFQTQAGKLVTTVGDTQSSCDELIGQAEQEHDVEILDIVNEEFLDPTATIEDAMAEAAGEEVDEYVPDMMEAQEEEEDVQPSYDMIEEEPIIMDVPDDAAPATEMTFE